jgi:putative ABC transport system substrate-binding protein
MTPASTHRRQVLAWWAAASLAAAARAVGAAGAELARSIAVVYPDIGEPFRSVFAKIVEGIEDQAKGHVPSFAVGGNANVAELANELHRHDVRVVIALGRNGLKAAGALDHDFAVVVGGVLSLPESETRSLVVHSLAPDPSLLFAQLRSLLPGARRVLVVHDPRQNAWLMRRARDAGRAQGLELVVQDAEDLKTAIRFYQEAFATADPRRDVLWLPQDSTTVDDSSVLPLVLQEAWNRGLAVFSSNVGHVKRGALFALYPNNVELGRSLAISAQAALASGNHAARGVLPLKDVLIAVNLRTANHLGIQLGGRQQAFDLVFPEP